MKKLTLLALLFLAGCDEASTTLVNSNFTLVHEVRMGRWDVLDIYQHKVSKRCYALWDSGYQGGFSQVNCEDFGVIPQEELEKQEYERLKEKYQ